MKNVIIGGTIRSGKSTLANEIRKKLHYSLVESDTIVNAFHKIFPELGIVHNKPDEAREKYKPFLFKMLNGFIKDMVFHGNVTVFPGSQFLPKHINEYDNKNHFIVIFLGINNVTPEQLLQKIRSSDSKHDWSKSKTDEELLKECERIIKESIELEKQCSQYGFYYFNTFENRDKIFKNIIKIIKKEQKIPVLEA